MNKKAVIDIGSLKTKLSIFDASRKTLISANSYLTLLGKGISEHAAIDESSLQKLEESFMQIAQLLTQESITDMAIIGTEALRKANNATEAQNLVAQYFPGHTIQIIDQHTEADLFFTAIGRAFVDQDIVAMDIGGGSVQLIYGRYDSGTEQNLIHKTYNLKTGTYRLQQQYSPDNTTISQDFDKAGSDIIKAYRDVAITSPILVFGSSCMLDFVQASGISVVRQSSSEQHPVSVEKIVLYNLLVDLRQLAPNARDHLYPDGGYFMYGADYLLLNVLQAIEQTQATTIYPTNLNSSYALI
jgi:exopolyphosphatase/pppGpp-phosphohydrolase